jgi:TetR/AcrR family transcriptional regulator, transcriptional repressor for nem operon
MSLNGGLRLSRKPTGAFIFAWFTSRIDSCRHLIIDDINNRNVNQGIAVIQKNLEEKIETMRKSKSEAAETRRHIIATASREFRRNGVNGTGLADLMSAAGLTHGGFYRHFKNKDHLVAEALTSGLDSIVEKMKAAGDSGGVNAMVSGYLSEAHRDDPSQGCPLAALGAETARCEGSVRDAATEGFTKLIDIITGQLTNIRPDTARKRALVVMSTMIGALTMSRIVDDPGLSDTILRQAERHIRDFLAGK